MGFSRQEYWSGVPYSCTNINKYLSSLRGLERHNPVYLYPEWVKVQWGLRETNVRERVWEHSHALRWRRLVLTLRHVCPPPHGEGKLRGAVHLENRKRKGKWDQKRVCGPWTLTFMHKLWRGELQGFSVIQLVLLSCWYRKEWKCTERLEFSSSAELGEERRHFAQYQVFLLKLARISDNKVEGELLGDNTGSRRE